MESPGYAYELAKFQVGLRFEDLPSEVVKKASDCVLDQLGVQIKGSTLDWGKLAAEFVYAYQGKPESTILNYGYRVPAFDAVYANATFGHGCELDDYDTNGLGAHSGVATVPVAMAFAELRPTSGRDFIVAIAAGYEIISRLGRLMKAGIRHRGFHAQGVLGVFGSVATAARMLDLDATQTMHAFAIAGSHAACTQEYDHTGGEVKRLHAGFAGRGGIQAALLAKRGLTGPPTIFEGAKGVLYAFGECDGDTSSMVQALGQDYAILRTAHKLYPCLGRAQAALDGVVRLMNENTFSIDQIKSIDIGVTESTLKHGGAIRKPTDMIGAQMSLPFSAALRVVKKSSDVSLYLDPKIWADPAILSVVDKIQLVVNAERVGDLARSAGVTITLSDGRRLHTEQPYPKGHIRNPVTWEDLTEKFTQLSTGVLSADQIADVIDNVRKLASLDNVASLIPMLKNSRAS